MGHRDTATFDAPCSNMDPIHATKLRISGFDVWGFTCADATIWKRPGAFASTVDAATMPSPPPTEAHRWQWVAREW